ncbi:glycosyltransferase 87 family protein [Paractinoplanes rishiriensis]|uniref:DUF2029 domain-containing protein n=1 Tax=Paractinoplanes rishiriensis TaxID=1050105 RepID=A0A919JZN8_9ACTN|nr:glycosyltransferase 87 family protein [Actinoplanes rishiriensis]GIE96482.1 hypothetical protein Ari01nite_39470 [Actinoplanes rishiriensis]
MTHLLTRLDRAAGGLAADLALYLISAAFAAITALTSTLLPHRAWGAIAAWAYAVATVVVITQLTLRTRFPEVAGTRVRAALAWATWAGAALLPLLVQSIQRAGGRTDRAQEEVLVVEHMGARLLDDGTPYLGRSAIAGLPLDERLMGYSPYQPAMSVFGLPKAVLGDFWWTDARIWFAAATAAALLTAIHLLRPGHSVHSAPSQSAPSEPGAPYPSSAAGPLGAFPPLLVRAIQAATVVPVCALTLATGGDDIPVLALCLLALALVATGRFGWAGLAVGAAAAMKLFALPVVAVLVILAIADRRARPLLPGALGLPVLVLIAPLLVDPDALVENVLRFPLGHGLVTSPAQSPFPGYLIAQHAPAGRLVALGLLLTVAAFIGVRMVRRPPTTAAAASLICGWGLLAAILLMPTTRFGYVLYPIAFLIWAPALVLRNHTAGRRPEGDTALYRL